MGFKRETLHKGECLVDWLCMWRQTCFTRVITPPICRANADAIGHRTIRPPKTCSMIKQQYKHDGILCFMLIKSVLLLIVGAAI